MKAQEQIMDAVVENLPQARQFVERYLDAAGFSPGEQMKTELAVEEIFVNIANYAYAPGTGEVLIRVETLGETAETPDGAAPGDHGNTTDVPEESTVVITFIDRGIPYDPLEKKDPDVMLSAKERPIGGLGIFITKKVMDEVAYECKDGQNILKIKKRRKAL